MASRRALATLLRAPAGAPRGLASAAARAALPPVPAPPPPPPGDGPAAAFDLVAPEAGLVRVDAVDDAGFLLGGVAVDAPVLLSRELWLLWRGAGAGLDGAAAEAGPLALLDLLRPPPALLVLGCGARAAPPPPALAAALRARGVAVEALATADAAATYNILAQEGRSVAAALLPAGVGRGDGP
jgi:uncharacterized protein